MSEDSTQLSVAELLARNGQGVPSSGGGRRRRGGRGIAVTDLTGDIPEVRAGSSHAAPDAEPEPEPMPDFQLAAPEYDNESPVSGPISYYDPLAGEQPSTPSWQQPNSFQPTAFEPAPAPDPGYQAAPGFGGFGTPDAYGAPAEPPRYGAPESAPFTPDAAPAPSGRRARRELREALAEQEAAAYAPEQPADTGRPGRRHRPEPDERHTMVVPPFSGAPQVDPVAAPWAPDAGRPEFGAPPPREFGAPDIPPPAAPGWNGAEAPRGLPAWSARRRAPAPAPRDFDQPGFGQQNFAPPNPVPQNPAPQDFAQPDFGGPEFDAPAADAVGEQHEDRAAGWSLAGRDAQLLSGQTVAGDLLRDANERGGGARRRTRGPRRGVIDLLDPAEAATEFYEPLDPDDDIDDEYDDDLLDDEDEQPSRWKRAAAFRKPSLPAMSALSLRLPRSASSAQGDPNRKQWLILGGQAVGAAVAGMLLFKGFEQIWDTMPFVALILAMVVILGLVALVRVLRRTDDILSTVIAVVVGIFVTLGPLAFLLSTN
ncbi:putative membrane protein [Nocardia nova SH22a]|uniref:Putative membrane protein n=1 Tax=Nocardia nova SH22a TaxID=1415166 RepID=W5TRA7_9NOCA|nr:hypothetical protein [Nocardia nova]AHH21802.1 putative membrane protein [Nocardia nova SH22a]